VRLTGCDGSTRSEDGFGGSGAARGRGRLWWFLARGSKGRCDQSLRFDQAVENRVKPNRIPKLRDALRAIVHT
jgi:hypothetical protein